MDRRPHLSANVRRSHSLAISPNLDALLKFEECHRGPPRPGASPDKVDNDLPTLSIPATPTSLPPPPRGHRISKTWLTSKTEPNSPNMATLQPKGLSTTIPMRPLSSSESNPYINPAPKLEDLLLTEVTTKDFVIGVDEGSSGCRESVSGQYSLCGSNEAHFDNLEGRRPKMTWRNSHAKEKQEIQEIKKTDSGFEMASSGVDSMFNFLSLSTPTRASSEAGKHSFIDFLSPGNSNDHTKPLSRQTDPTHLLDPNERAKLVKKTTKLARVFGQTPEAGILLHTFSDSRRTAAHLSSRRHSLPLTLKAGDSEVSSPISFMDLSDEDDDDISVITPTSQLRRPPSIASSSLIESISQEEQAKERRRKREKLVKLHRFLGSRVLPSLVLGLEEPSISPPSAWPSTSLGNGDSKRKTWMRRRRSSSAAEFPSSWSDKDDRLRVELCSREKAINVKRAQKMEKVFGVAPPQTLYHTRHIPASSFPGIKEPYMARMERNQNRTAYTKHWSRRFARSSSADSREDLLTKDINPWKRDPLGSSPVPTRAQKSKIYTHYEHSLNSLHDILDKEDRVSLAELHHYLTSDDCSSTSPLFQISPTEERHSSVTSSDRRHSLPASITSISSDISFTESRPDLTDFQLRRRKAAKLTNFFGVDYCVLIQDVLESIKSGLEHECKRGTLAAEEAEDLLHQLQQLTLKRPHIY